MIVTTYDVFCDLCMDHIGDTTQGLAVARRIAKRAGWHRDRKAKIDLCPRCKDDHKNTGDGELWRERLQQINTQHEAADAVD